MYVSDKFIVLVDTQQSVDWVLVEYQSNVDKKLVEYRSICRLLPD